MDWVLLGFVWSGRRDSTPGPPEPHAGTLPNCATSRPEPAFEQARGGAVNPESCPLRPRYTDAMRRRLASALCLAALLVAAGVSAFTLDCCCEVDMHCAPCASMLCWVGQGSTA